MHVVVVSRVDSKCNSNVINNIIIILDKHDRATVFFFKKSCSKVLLKLGSSNRVLFHGNFLFSVHVLFFQQYHYLEHNKGKTLILKQRSEALAVSVISNICSHFFDAVLGDEVCEYHTLPDDSVLGQYRSTTYWVDISQKPKIAWEEVSFGATDIM